MCACLPWQSTLNFKSMKIQFPDLEARDTSWYNLIPSAKSVTISCTVEKGTIVSVFYHHERIKPSLVLQVDKEFHIARHNLLLDQSTHHGHKNFLLHKLTVLCQYLLVHRCTKRYHKQIEHITTYATGTNWALKVPELSIGDPAGAPSSSLISTTTTSDVRNVFATELACSKQHLTTCRIRQCNNQRML